MFAFEMKDYSKCKQLIYLNARFVDSSRKYETLNMRTISFFFSRDRLYTRPGGSVVTVSDSRPGGCEFYPRLKQTFFPAYFCLSPLQKHVRKVVGGFGKKNCVSTGVKARKHLCITHRHDMTLAVKVTLNPNKTNQPKPLYPNATIRKPNSHARRVIFATGTWFPCLSASQPSIYFCIFLSFLSFDLRIIRAIIPTCMIIYSVF